MKNKFIKTLCLLTVICTVLSSAKNVYADDKVLHVNVDTVINKAINNSSKLALKEKEIKMLKDKIKLQDHANEAYDDLGVDGIKEELLEFKYDKLVLDKKQSEKSREFLKDSITNEIEDKYNDIVLAEIELENLKNSLVIENTEAEFIREKAYVGSAKKIDVTDKNIEIKKLKDSIQAKENMLKINKEYLGVLTDMNLNNAVFSRDLNYYKFTLNKDIDEYIDDKLNE